MNKFNIEKEIRKYRNTPFKYGGITPEGYDCLGFVTRFYINKGIDLPRSCEEATEDNYSEIYLANENRADELLLKYFDLLPGKEVNHMELLAGDFLVVKNKKNNHLFPAIYGGNGVGITSFINSYVRPFSIEKNWIVVKARRIL